MKLRDDGGLLRGQEDTRGEEVNFFVRDGGLVAFVDLPFRTDANDEAIAEIVLGPKNPNAPGNVL